MKTEIELDGKMYWIDKEELDAQGRFYRDQQRKLDPSGVLRSLGLIE